MKQMSKVENLEKGDIVTVFETSPVFSIEKDTFENVTFIHKFEIIRNNNRTYGCKYIEGAYKNSGFNWIKGFDLTADSKRTYFIE